MAEYSIRARFRTMSVMMAGLLAAGIVLAIPPKWLAEAGERMNWNAAKSYCTSIGGVLPTEADLQDEIRACGGKLTGEYFPQENEINYSYQSCMSGKGWTGDYWTSSTPAESQTCAFDVYSKTGSTGCGSKADSNLKVRCKAAK